MADAQLELPCQLDWIGHLRSALTAIRSPRLGRTIREPVIRAFLPSATKVELLRRPGGASRRTTAACSKTLSKKRTLSVPDLQAVERTEDPYAFGLLLGESDLFLFNEGRHCCPPNAFKQDRITAHPRAAWHDVQVEALLVR
jgi:hypothetical protein